MVDVNGINGQAVTFVECNNLMVRNIRLENAQQMHMRVQKCENVKALNLMVTSPGHSPNTDGIHVTGTRNILVQDSIIRTGNQQSFFRDYTKKINK